MRTSSKTVQAGELEAFAEEAAKGKLGHLHGAGGVVLVLAQEQEVLAELIFGERGRIALEVLGQFAHVADVFLFGGRSKVL